MGFFDIFGITPSSMASKLVKLDKINISFENRLTKIEQMTIDILSPASVEDLKQLRKEIDFILPKLHPILVNINTLEKRTNENIKPEVKQKILGMIDTHLDDAIRYTKRLRFCVGKLNELAGNAETNADKRSLNDPKKNVYEKVAHDFKKEVTEFEENSNVVLKLEKKLETKENKR